MIPLWKAHLYPKGQTMFVPFHTAQDGGMLRLLWPHIAPVYNRDLPFYTHRLRKVTHDDAEQASVIQQVYRL